MKEDELLHEIVRIVRDADGMNVALGRIQHLLASEWGGALLIIRPSLTKSTISIPPAVSGFLESQEFPFRGLYVAPVNTGARAAGTLVACIGTWGAPREIFRRVTNFAGQQLTDLANRLSLREIEYAEAT
ncbi:MAG TPA: hypothetical protein VNH18_31710 [Bryobacteraceae bacterium]|nr:hypothetical protein [Bryobacteraceae bacterium]